MARRGRKTNVRGGGYPRYHYGGKIHNAQHGAQKAQKEAEAYFDSLEGVYDGGLTNPNDPVFGGSDCFPACSGGQSCVNGQCVGLTHPTGDMIYQSNPWGPEPNCPSTCREKPDGGCDCTYEQGGQIPYFDNSFPGNINDNDDTIYSPGGGGGPSCGGRHCTGTGPCGPGGYCRCRGGRCIRI